VGPIAVLDAVVKRKIPSPRQESNPRTPIVQPVAQCYTDWLFPKLKSALKERRFRGTEDIKNMTKLKAIPQPEFQKCF
jgi:hypothetical protein